MNQERATQPQDRGAFLPGDIVGEQIEILREIGRGGMGVVYEARNRTTGARLALKTILPRHIENMHAAERFVREIALARGLAHRNIVTVFDVGRERGKLFFTMEYLDGITLREMLRRKGAITLKQAAWILNGISEALAYAHGKGIVHRDLSPENVMILRDNSVRLLDFGLARAMNRPLLTAPGKAMGKAFYIAPEQRRDASSVDARADLYSLGVMFYEMLSGQLPTGYHRLADLLPELPEECDTLVENTVAPLDRRIGSVAVFRQLLSACVEASQRNAAGPKRRLALPVRWKTAAVCAAAFLAVLVIAAGVLPVRPQRSQFLPAPLLAKPPTEPGNPVDALSYVWDAAHAESPITRLRFAPSPMMGRLFELEGSGVNAHGFYELGNAGNGQDARILRLKLNSVAMLGGAMFGLNGPVSVEALVRIEGDTMTLATRRKWLEALKPVSNMLSVIPNIGDKREAVDRMKELDKAQQGKERRSLPRARLVAADRRCHGRRPQTQCTVRRQPLRRTHAGKSTERVGRGRLSCAGGAAQAEMGRIPQFGRAAHW
jgi:serine/threonine-protein kinase